MADIKLGVFVLIAATLAAHTSAADTANLQTFNVGDAKGWAPGVDFKGWAARDFLIGDKLVFKYDAGKYNVLEVDAKSFEDCTVPPNPKKSLTSGDDTLDLETGGIKYFICGTEDGKYCKSDNMKIKIDVPDQYKSGGPSGPKEYVVGDDKGWAVDVDYNAWVEGKDFNKGDKLVFKYPAGTQNVNQVNPELYKDCTLPPDHPPLATGQDYVSLPGIGDYGFFSSVDNNCAKGVKVMVKVECPLKKKVQGGRKLVPN